MVDVPLMRALRSLVDYEQIALERRLFGASEGPGPRVGFEEAVDGLGFQARALGQALCRATGRGAEGNRDGLVFYGTGVQKSWILLKN
jgi:hypothetical protein